MTTDVWNVVVEAQRLSWAFTPLQRVGPLEFGMTHDQVTAAVRGTMSVAVSQGTSSNDGWAEFWLDRGMDARFTGPAVTTYYDDSIGLAGIAVNALRGPQVTLDGMRLVGQTPSRLEDEFRDYLAAQSREPWYSQSADLCSPPLGLVLRAQRAGDVVLSRPVIVAAAWADRCYDTSEGRIPEREWKTFEW
ncbi:hypothetical protein [Plantactinospora soyae]|uniref:Uncharacterized protein n=1 Tax=Plantactinospora soyae TaxID=1544732 RepID=A0A927RAT7_9ACTN|nr:hypothetical protein [Plantactinospora soyae]MBE1491026.1 hypothetical protein [Plantactinospora soyae]